MPEVPDLPFEIRKRSRGEPFLGYRHVLCEKTVKFTRDEFSGLYVVSSSQLHNWKPFRNGVLEADEKFLDFPSLLKE